MKIINSQNKITNVLIVGTKNYRNMTVFTAGPGSVPTYIFGIHSCLLYCNTPIQCKLELEGKLFVTKECTILLLLQEIAEIQNEYCFVL